MAHGAAGPYVRIGPCFCGTGFRNVMGLKKERKEMIGMRKGDYAEMCPPYTSTHCHMPSMPTGMTV